MLKLIEQIELKSLGLRRYRYELPPGKESTFVIGESPVLSLEQARGERNEQNKAKQRSIDWERVEQGTGQADYLSTKTDEAVRAY